MKRLEAYEHGFTDPLDLSGLEFDWIVDYLKGFGWEPDVCILGDGRPKTRAWFHHPDGISVLFRYRYDAVHYPDPVNPKRYVFANPGKRYLCLPETIVRP